MVLLAFLGMYFLLVSHDLFIFWFLAIELQFFVFMRYLRMYKSFVFTNEAGLKYFIFGSLEVPYTCLVFHNLFDLWYIESRCYKALSFFELPNQLYIYYMLLYFYIFFFIL